MTSNDRDILLEINGRLIKIESRLDGIESRVGNLESGVTALAHQQELIANRLDMGIWFAGLCFGVLALVIAFVGIFAPKFWEYFSRKTKPAPEVDIDEVADRVIQIISRRYELKPKR